MFDKTGKGKVKNRKIQLRRAELGCFDYRIHHRPEKLNVVPDSLSRIQVAASTYSCDLADIHKKLAHPGITRLVHFVRTKNLPFSVDDVKRVCSNCKICAKIKPRFYKKEEESLIKATRPWERISIDFKGPAPGPAPYIFIVTDEFSRYPFVFPCKDLSTATVIRNITQLFVLFGLPMYVHSGLLLWPEV